MKSSLSLGALALAVWALRPQTVVAGVNLYGEMATSGSIATVNIYADTSTSSLMTFGVRLLYDTNNLYVIAAAKNTAVWYLSTGGTNVPYLDPDTSVPGQVTILGARLDTLNPLQGVSGQHVLLGTVTLGRLSDAGPQFALALGRPGAFDNFVTTGGDVLDHVAGGVVIDTVYSLRMIGVTRVAGGVSVQWQGGIQATQFLQRRFSLGANDPWVDVFTNPPPTAPTVAYTDPIGTNGMMFYRVRAQP